MLSVDECFYICIMKRLILSIILIASTLGAVSAQEYVLHRHGRNEIAISPGGVYSLSDKEWGFGAHLHYFRTLSSTSPWALGAGVEAVAMHGGHYTVSVGAKYNFLHFLNISVMPGVTFFGKDNHNHREGDDHHHHNKKAQFSAHFEFSYELIHTEFFHLGPAIDFSWCKGDNHFMVGLHCAYSF